MALALKNRRQGQLKPETLVAVDWLGRVLIGTVKKTTGYHKGEIYEIDIEGLGIMEMHSSYVIGEVEGGR